MLRLLFGNSRIVDDKCMFSTEAYSFRRLTSIAIYRRTLRHWRNVGQKYAKQMVKANTARSLDDESE